MRVNKACAIGTALAFAASGCQLAAKEGPNILYGPNEAQQAETYVAPIEDTFFNQCHDGEYDFDSRCIDFTQGYVQDAKNGVYLFNKTIEVNMFGMIGEQDLEGICSSFLLEDGLLLTAGHCEAAEPPLPPFATVTGAEYSITHEGKRYELEKIATGGDVDVALFRVKNPEGLPYLPFALGDTDKITEGNVVYLFGYTGLSDVNVRDGIVGVKEDTSTESPEATGGYFEITNGADHGDSGGLVIGFRDGIPEILGVLCYRYNHHRGGTLKLGTIPEEIMRHLRK